MVNTHPLATLIAARILGPFLIAAGAAMIVQHERIVAVADALLRDDALAVFAGFLSLLTGLIIVAFHDYWRNFTQIVISLMGWISMLRGLALIFALNMARTAMAHALVMPQVIPIVGCVLAILGLWLAFVGFIGRPEDTSSHEQA